MYIFSYLIVINRKGELINECFKGKMAGKSFC